MAVLLQINDIHKAYGASVILDGASASFGDDQKIGVIGRNGAGKSTLCRIITGHDHAEHGTITRNSALRLSYLEQHDSFHPGEPVLDFLMRKSSKEHWECAQVAARFQIHNAMLEMPVQNLAGGYQTRVKLAAMLLGDPNFLILDEPSNYLDLSTLILLENFLNGFRGGYLVVSHDREFLKRTCDHTLEIENGKLALYPGDIEEYFEFKEEQLAQKQAYNIGVEKKREQLQEFIDRFRAKASTASRAQSKMKQLEKLKTIAIGHTQSNVRIHIPRVEAKAGVAFECEGLSVGYPEKTVAAGINICIDRGTRVAILGNNGEGKTTFLRTIAGDLEVKDGSFRWGSGLKIAYYAQHVFSSLHPEDDVYTHLSREAVDGVTNQEILTMAGCFLFKGDDVKKKVSVLSGGERARLLLAGLLLSKSHVLLLDEPTNHLDFETVEALASALRSFAGTVFFICHDRTFVNLVATNIIEVKRGKIQRYPGSYEDYVYHLEMVARGEAVEDDSSPETEKPQKLGKEKKEPKKREKSETQKEKAEIRKIQRQMVKTEHRIKGLQQEQARMVQDMTDNPFKFSKDRSKRLKDIQTNLEEAESEWCEFQARLDELEKKQKKRI